MSILRKFTVWKQKLNQWIRKSEKLQSQGTVLRIGESDKTDESLRAEIQEDSWMTKSLDSLVRCIHCGKVFYGDELRVFKKGDSHFVYCKFPDCDGSIIDIIDARDEDFASMFGY